jgi:hypothetical protein
VHRLIDPRELFGLLFAPRSLKPVNSLNEKPPFAALRTCAGVVEVGFADLVPVLGLKIFDFFLFFIRIS